MGTMGSPRGSDGEGSDGGRTALTGAGAERWQEVAGTSETLVRSRLEVERILRAVAGKQTPVTAYFPEGDHLFVSRLRRVDADLGLLVMDYGSDKAANAALLAARRIPLSSNEGGAQVEFLGNDPAETLLDQVPAIRMQFPQLLLIRQRRAHRRIGTLPGVPLRCIADAGGAISFEAEIVDISLGGIGAMIYDAGITLAPGTVLKGCKIVHPRGAVVEVDIEIRHTGIGALADGTPACRSGCRFLGPAGRIEELMRVFVLDLER